MHLLNRGRATSLMEEQSLDAVIATTPEHVLYASGFYSLGQWHRLAVQAFAVIQRDPGAPTAVVLSMADADLALALPGDQVQLFPYGQFYYTVPDSSALGKRDQRLADLSAGPTAKTPLEALIAAITALGLTRSRLGVDTGRLWPTHLGALQEALPAASIEDAYGLLQRVRMIKTPPEIEYLRRAVFATEEAFLATTRAFREGITEQEIARIYEQTLVEHGAEPVLTVIGFGEHSAHPNARPGTLRLHKDMVVRYDIGCRYQGYFADIARIAVFGTPSPVVRSYYQALWEGEEAALQIVRPGTTADEIFRVAVERTRAAGIPHYERTHVGHGIGIEVYDPPLLAPGIATALEPGMVINVETPYYELGFCGLQVEDTVVVTDDGFDFLTTSSRDLYVV